MRGIRSADNLVAQVEGDLEDTDGVTKITRIRLRYRFKVPPGTRGTVAQVLASYADRCPAYQSVKGSIACSWDAEVEVGVGGGEQQLGAKGRPATRLEGQPVKPKVGALAIGIIGLLVAWRGLSTLRYYRSFTETAEGVVVRRDGNEVVIRFHEDRSAPAPQQVQFAGEAEYAFPLTDGPATLKVSDTVAAYHPPGRLHEARLDKDFSYLLPAGLAAAGVAFVIAAGALWLMSGRRKWTQRTGTSG